MIKTLNIMHVVRVLCARTFFLFFVFLWFSSCLAGQAGMLPSRRLWYAMIGTAHQHLLFAPILKLVSTGLTISLGSIEY